MFTNQEWIEHRQFEAEVDNVLPKMCKLNLVHSCILTFEHYFPPLLQII